MTTFSELLKKAREQSDLEYNINHQITPDLILTKNNINTNKVIEDVIEIKPDTSNEIFKLNENNKINKKINLAAKIIIISKEALELSKKLRGGSNSCKRLAKSIVDGKINKLQLEKAMKIIDTTKTMHINYKLCGGSAMRQLSNYIYFGMSIESALHMEYIEKD